MFGAGALVAIAVAMLLGGVLARNGFPLPPADRRIGCIDGLRGYLALSVMIHHFFIWTNITRMGGAWEPPQINFINQLGTTSVSIFFMVTGLVFYPVILRDLSRTNWIALYIGRAFRIIPLVTFAVIVVSAIIILRTGNSPDKHYVVDLLKWITAWSEVPLMHYQDSARINAYVLWSLHYEWIYYILILPLSALAMRLIRYFGMSTLILPLLLLSTILFRNFLPQQIGSKGIVFYLPFFAIGMLAFEAQARPQIRAALSKSVYTLPAIFSLAIAMTVTNSYSVFSLPFMGFFFICVACGNRIFGLLDNKASLIISECSFGIYLLHGIFLDILFEDIRIGGTSLDTALLPVFLPIVSFVVILATASTYLMVERPAIQRGKAFARWLTGHGRGLGAQQTNVAP